MNLEFPPDGAEWTFFICACVILLGPYVAGKLRLPGMVGIVTLLAIPVSLFTQSPHWLALGYCGNSGVARGTYFGHKVALKVVGDSDGRTAYDDLTFPAFPAQPIAKAAVPIVEAFMSARDRFNI